MKKLRIGFLVDDIAPSVEVNELIEFVHNNHYFDYPTLITGYKEKKSESLVKKFILKFKKDQLTLMKTDANNAIYIVTGMPRSGTTITADRIADKLNKAGLNAKIYDEIDPTRFVKDVELYYRHLLARSSLIRNPTRNETAHRFSKKKTEFLALELDYVSRFKRIFMNDHVPIFKYPGVLEDTEFRSLLIAAVDAQIAVNLIYCVREDKEVIRSFRDRKMHFSNIFFGYWALKLWMFFERKYRINILKHVVHMDDNLDEKLINGHFVIDREELIHVDKCLSNLRTLTILKYYRQAAVLIRKRILRRRFW